VVSLLVVLCVDVRGQQTMCLGVPGKVVSVAGTSATVDFWGVKREIMVSTANEPVQPGDYVLVHVGFAIRKIPAEDVAGTLEFYDDLLAEQSADLMAQDVQDEISSAR
jgi:hydrogenase expression/formation protein HypC